MKELKGVVLGLAVLAITSRAEDQVDDVKVDPNGYVMFCPCMGEFSKKSNLECLVYSRVYHKIRNACIVHTYSSGVVCRSVR